MKVASLPRRYCPEDTALDLDPCSQEEVEAHLNDLTAAVIGDTGLRSWLPCELRRFCMHFDSARKQESV